MTQDNNSNDCDLKSSRQTRVPIPLSAEEEERLVEYAKTDKRSKSSMAGIIYRLGEQAYTKLPKGRR